MDKKSKIILILLVITLLSLSSYASLSRFSKGINKLGSIQTTELGYCGLNEIETLSECLIRNDSKQELDLALNTINSRTNRLDLSKIEPTNIFEPTTTYKDIDDKTNENYYVGVTNIFTFTYVIESKLINPFSIDDNEIENINFNIETAYYTFTNSLTGGLNDIVTTSEDMANGIYKYTCLNNTSNGNCQELYLFTEEAYLVSNYYYFKQGYVYSNVATNTTNMNAGLYRGVDDYTVDEDTYTYYYRGDVNNNWVKYGDYLWRVVRINGNGAIRMIYSGLVNAPGHSGGNASMDSGTYSNRDLYDVSFSRVKEPYSLATISYRNGKFMTTYAGYMYNPNTVVKTFPSNMPSNEAYNSVYYFPTYDRFNELSNYYFFKNFDPAEDCYLGDGTDDSGTCVLKCNKLGNYGDEDADCVYTTWPSLSENPANYSTTAPGVFKSSSGEYYMYQMSDTDGGYRYVCVDDVYTAQFPEGDAYSVCPTVIEIVGTIKNQPKRAKVRYHSVFSENETISNTNIADSNIKKKIDTWYENNILNQKDENNNYLEDYLSDGIFCNDRSNSMYTNFPLSNSTAGAYYDSDGRIVVRNSPSFKCLKSNGTFNTNDAFTLKTSNTPSRVESDGIGNNMLDYPIALISADEVTFAGGKSGTINKKYYLYTGLTWWTMTPVHFDTYTAQVKVFAVTDTGSISSNIGVVSSYGIRPVINLKSDILYKGGNGTESDPYIIEPNN